MQCYEGEEKISVAPRRGRAGTIRTFSSMDEGVGTGEKMCVSRSGGEVSLSRWKGNGGWEPRIKNYHTQDKKCFGYYK